MEYRAKAYRVSVDPAPPYACRIHISEENTRNHLVILLKDAEQVKELREQLKEFEDAK